ncbi:MAG: 2-amino-4-hydroxy-6-hydroxymethyldihydropteridine diphosphokinase, partial [Lachnospiraceae bacterium]|nr:2-amino-4-hydroxy-6-hydroxymethyldihydropteridine diphosphokinase [Lachnospiraceae bacterium]
LDILFYDDIVLDTMELTIPHPEIAKRDFVLRPMAQIAWHLRHPLTHKSINETYSELSEVLCRQK